jgi:heterodisulfide reductase subunit A
MKAGEIELDPFVAEVDPESCSGCRICLNACPFSAIERNEEEARAEVNSVLCTGCGTCVATCPCDAIQQHGFDDGQVRAELMALLGVEQQEEVLV